MQPESLLSVRAMRTWIIGSSPDCDVVVAQPTVSGRHCRLTETADAYLLEDLGSSNGTYVNGDRIAAATRVSGGEVITLGKSVPMPWPKVMASPPARIIRIGRFADNDIVLEDQRVSAHHAQLIISGAQTLIEDLGSGNGTFVNSRDQRVTQAVPLREQDVVFFGTLEVPAARLLSKRTVRDPIAVDSLPHVSAEAISGPAAAAPSYTHQWALALLAQSPAIALLIVLVFGGRTSATITAANWASVANAVAAATFSLALAAVWLGCSAAVWGFAGGFFRPRFFTQATLLGSRAARLVGLAVWCVVQDAVLLALVLWGCGLNGSGLVMFGFLILASMVGLSIGLVLSRLARSRTIAATALLICFLAMIALGGWMWPLPELNPAACVATAVVPARWAFEGLLLSEVDSRSIRPSAAVGPESAPVDMGEGFFPALTERMGPEADALALASMLIALASFAAFISARPKPVP